MPSRLGKALASVALAAALVGVSAGPAHAAPTVTTPTASSAHTDFWYYGCYYGYACLELRNQNQPNPFWNVEHCGDNGIRDYYWWAKASGNPFTVYYQDGRWDYVAAWSQRTLDQNNLAVMVRVHC
ncbi:hypothetical protein [Micromonospora zhanjiangensis]|uniref:Peptidase inhibitor family I36 n=1 Tax=Micromonospora zhanjiangensis TaxID=1522057 RepID=A0ABV8KP57_9ACTN